MDGIKDTILLLCNLINKMYDEKLLSVHFSHGKFDRSGDQTINTFWKIIHKIVCERKCSDIIFCSKKMMLTRFNYKIASFYDLPRDNSYGSRELLLALCKLITDFKLEEALDKIISKSVLISEFPIETCNESIKNEPNDQIIYGSEDFIKLITYKAGKIRKYLQTVEHLSNERQTETKEVHTETSSMPCVSLLTVLEVSVLSNKKQLYPNYFKELKHSTDVLDAYFLWLKRKKQFILWIRTVIDLKKKNSYLINGTHLNNQRVELKMFFAKLEETNEISAIDKLPSGSTAKYYKKSVQGIMESMALQLQKQNYEVLLKPNSTGI